MHKRFFSLVDSDFRSALFKLTAMLIHNTEDSGKIIAVDFDMKSIDDILSR